MHFSILRDFFDLQDTFSSWKFLCYVCFKYKARASFLAPNTLQLSSCSCLFSLTHELPARQQNNLWQPFSLGSLWRPSLLPLGEFLHSFQGPVSIFSLRSACASPLETSVEIVCALTPTQTTTARLWVSVIFVFEWIKTINMQVP